MDKAEAILKAMLDFSVLEYRQDGNLALTKTFVEYCDENVCGHQEMDVWIRESLKVWTDHSFPGKATQDDLDALFEGTVAFLESAK